MSQGGSGDSNGDRSGGDRADTEVHSYAIDRGVRGGPVGRAFQSLVAEELNGMQIRAMTTGDIDRVAALAGELGYPVEPDVLGQRFASLTGGDTEVVYVAELGGDVVGWIHLREFYDLLEEPTMEIRGLVVDARCRGEGIGQSLVDAGEIRARHRGIGRMRVTSNIVRERAHRFYERLNYAKVKTSIYMVKPLDPTDG